ncbi:hypothetical protein GLGCALEP_05266 [Pseudomonas sp. MM221]|nr:hypothetical protein DBADOPDK_05143 [Pseudomonas sp. MM223]CAI3808969.1 hypothetical protein GLGCALEP_05266 [Pseudomonas sp. MM221]
MNLHEFAPESIDALIAKRLPSWMHSASLDHLQALHRAMRLQQKSAQRVRELMAPIPSLDQFAEPLLNQALQRYFQLNTDVRASRVRIVQQVFVPPIFPTAPRVPYLHISSRPLLAAALHNYTEAETRPGGLTEASLQNAKKQPLALDFTRFATLCRTLDLGGGYQALLKQHLQPKDRQAMESVNQCIEEDLRARLDVAVRLALLQGHIDQSSYLQLLPFVAPKPIVHGTPAQLLVRQLYLLGKPIEGVVALEVRATQDGPLQGVICWVPDDPVQPVQRHASWDALYAAFAMRLRGRPYAQFFMRFVRERERASFTNTLNTLIKATDTSAAIELDGRHFSVDGTLFAYLRQLRIAKMLDDARVLAVPTGDEDSEARRLRFEGYMAAGLNLLGLAGLFVPVLGQVMFAVAAVQIAKDVYEGYESWQLGDRQAALGHLFGVAENVAVGMVLAAGGAAAGRVLERVTFVDELVPCVGEDGEVRLVRHDYEPYQVNTAGWQVVLERPHEWSGVGLLMRRLSSQLADVTDEQASLLARITGIDEAHLRRLHLEHAEPLARLLDAWQRYQLHEQYPALRGDAFEARFNALQAQADPAQVLLLRDFPGLTRRTSQALVEAGDGQQVAEMLDTQRVPLALAERARWSLRDSRVDRACAGLCQSSATNTDSEHLILRLVERLAPWPAKVCLEVREGANTGALLARSGAPEAEQMRYILRTEWGYLAEDSEGVPLPGAWSEDSLVQAVLLHLEPGQMLLLGDASLTQDAFTETLLKAVNADREQVAALLGMAPVGEGLRPPQRFADGRVGYPLSGRMPSSRQAARRGIQQLYPLLDDEHLERYMVELLARRVDPWQHYNQLRRQLDRLRQALQTWRDESSGVLDGWRRQRVINTIRRCWRRKSRRLADGGNLLAIRGERIGNLPNLPDGVTFPHVTHLTLHGLNLNALQADFLPRFPNLVELDLGRNNLAGLPAGIEQLTSLRRLRLGHNQITIDTRSNQRLSALTRLEQLDLSHNPLGQALDVQALRHLRELGLNSVDLTHFPDRAQQLPWQGVADLRNNRIQHIRDELDNLRLRLQRAVVHDNPLDETSQALLSLAAREPRNVRPIDHQLIDEAAREFWLADTADTLRSERDAMWRRVREAPESAGLFQFLRDFSRTSDFREHSVYYRERGWRIVEACDQNGELRDLLFAQANGPRTCEDQMLFILSELEITLHIERKATGGSLAHREDVLLRTGRELSRLDDVNRIAARKVEALSATDRLLDPIEVYLAYRTQLSVPLGLPAQPGSMHYRSFSRVTTADLNAARTSVLRQETPARLSASLAERPFWDRYVHERYPERIEALVESFAERLTQAERLPEQQYLEHSAQLRSEYENQLRDLRLTLAQQAYARYLHLPATSGG